LFLRIHQCLLPVSFHQCSTLTQCCEVWDFDHLWSSVSMPLFWPFMISSDESGWMVWT